MKSICTVLVLSLLLFSLEATSQNESGQKTIVVEKVSIVNTPAPNPFWDRFSIRKSFESKTENDEKAATISFTYPKDNDKIFNTNAGIGYTFPRKADANHELTTFFVYNKNTQIDKRQENYKFGLTHNYIYFTKKDFGFINDNSLQYLNDNTKKAQSMMLLSYLSFRYNRGFPILSSYALKENLFAYKFDPKIGLEYQNSYDVAEPLEDGYYFRSYFNIGGSILMRKKTVMKTATTTTTYSDDGKTILKTETKEEFTTLNKMFWKKGMELSVNYEGRNSLADNFDENPSYLYFLKGELKLYPILDDNFSVSISYNKGENPLDGLEKQEFWMLSLSFKK